MSETVEDGCLCGAIRYAIAVPIEEIVLCHCTHCRKSSGAGASANSPVPSERFELTKGEPKHYADLSFTHILTRSVRGVA